MDEKHPNAGPSLDDFLRQDGILDQATAADNADVIAWLKKELTHAQTDRDAFRADHIASANENAALRAKVAALETVLMPFVDAGQWMIDRGLSRKFEAIPIGINGPDEAVTYGHFIDAADHMKGVSRSEAPHFNGLSPAEAERLFMLMEEHAEVIKAACKVGRHGYASYNPDNEAAGTNRQQLKAEISDTLAVEGMMFDAGDIVSPLGSEIDRARERKLKYAHHQAVKS